MLSGYFGIEITKPVFDFMTTQTFGDLSVSVRKTKMYFKSSTGTVGSFEIETPDFDFDVSGYESSGGSLSIQMPAARFKRFI
jgi:hypothetical protein